MQMFASPVVAGLCAVLMFGTADATAGAGPDIFFYPPPFRIDEHTVISSPEAVGLEQVTRDTPKIPEMTGVVLLFTWGRACPTIAACDYALIDKALDYWSRLGKKVVLGFPAMSFPDINRPGEPGEYFSATPHWVLSQIRVLQLPAPLLGGKGSRARIAAEFPDFNDDRFASLVADWVKDLAKKFDGNPVIAQIRIATGVLGEDNPQYGTLNSVQLLQRNRQWLQFCRKMTDLYVAEFKQTELEFDLGRLSELYLHGDDFDRLAVDAFIESLRVRHVLLAFNGLQSKSREMLQSRGRTKFLTPEERSLAYILDVKNAGGRVGLEAMDWLSGPVMQDVDAILGAEQVVRPDRLVFFSDFTGAVLSQSSIYHERAVKLLSGCLPRD